MKNFLIFLTITIIFNGCGIINKKEIIPNEVNNKIENIKIYKNDYKINDDILKLIYENSAKQENIISSEYLLKNYNLFNDSIYSSNISFNNSKSYGNDNKLISNSNSFSFNNTLDLDLWGKIKNNKSINEYNQLIQTEEKRNKINSNFQILTNVYFNIIYLNNLKNLNEEKIKIFFKQLNNIKSMLKYKQNDIKYYLTMETQLNTYKKDLNVTNLQLKEYQKIANIYGIKLNTVNKFPNIEDNFNLQNLMNRSDYKISLFNLRINDLKLSKSIKEQYPDFSLTGTLSSSGKIDLLFDQWIRNIVSNIAIPIFNNDIKYSIETNENNLNSSINNFYYLIKSTKSEVKTSFLNYNVFIKNKENLEKQLKVLKEQENLILKNIKLKNSNIIEYYNNQISQINIKSNILEFEKNILNNKIELLIKTGEI